MRKVIATKDDSSHWYIIPNELHDEFCLDNENEEMIYDGKFDEKWGKYMTGGDLNLIQLYAEV